jgi:hypothetical protein
MADDPALRSLFRSLETDAEVPAIDVTSVVRRSRRRRLPAQLGVGAIGLVAVGLLVVGVTTGVSAFRTETPSMSDSGALAGEDDGTATTTESSAAPERAPVDGLNPCGGTLAEVAPSSTGLTLTTSFDDVPADAASVTGVVTLTNTGAETLVGSTTLYPAITLSQDGVTVWHSNGVMDSAARIVDLAPGASMDYEATFEPVRCGAVDDGAVDDLDEQFPDGLPRVAPGRYQVSAAIHFRADTPGSTLPDADLITSPLQTISVH